MEAKLLLKQDCSFRCVLVSSLKQKRSDKKLFNLPGRINQVLLQIVQIFGIGVEYITRKALN